MVASALKEISGWENDILFASGVSNSGEQSDNNYQREIDLVKLYLGKIIQPASFVYFSTSSIFDPSKAMNPYILHKLKIEALIKNSSVNYLIVRLPNLVGYSDNPNTLTNYFADSIRLNRPIILKSQAIRHLIDAKDLAAILCDIKSKFGTDKIVVNVETSNPLRAEQILVMIENGMNKKAIIQNPVEARELDSGNKDLKSSSVNYRFNTEIDYHRNLLMKYYSTQ